MNTRKINPMYFGNKRIQENFHKDFSLGSPYLIFESIPLFYMVLSSGQG